MARKVWVYGRLLVPVAVVLAGLAGGLAVWVASGQAEQSPTLAQPKAPARSLR